MKIQPQPVRESERGVRVLLIRDGAEHWGELKAALESQSLRVCDVGRFSEAENCLKGPEPPQLVFTAVLLVDGGWEQAVRLGKRTGVPVIVVSTRMDGRFCLEVLEKGAFDFVVPPLEPDDVAYLVRNAGCRAEPWLAPRAA